MQSTITIKEARKILGKQASNLSDIQIIELLLNLQELSRKFIKSVGSNNSSGV